VGPEPATRRIVLLERGRHEVGDGLLGTQVLGRVEGGQFVCRWFEAVNIRCSRCCGNIDPNGTKDGR
jgi:hypothetical protein